MIKFRSFEISSLSTSVCSTMNEYIIFFQKVIPGVNQSIMYIQREEQVLQTIAKIQQDNS